MVILFYFKSSLHGRVTALYVVFIPLEYVLGGPSHSTYVIVFIIVLCGGLRGVANLFVFQIRILTQTVFFNLYL